MSLHLREVDNERLRLLSEALLSPLEYPDPERWCELVLRRLETLFDADRSLFILPLGGRVTVQSESVPDEPLRALRHAFSHDAPTDLRNVAVRVRQRARLHVYSHATLARAAGVPLAALPGYNEVLVPAGVTQAAGVVASLPTGDAWLSVADSRPPRARFSEAERLQLLQLVWPSFKSGTEAASRTRARDMVDVLDVVAQGYALYDINGRELHRSDRLTHLLAREPERQRVLASARVMVQSLVGLRWSARRRRSEQAHVSSHIPVQTASASYELRALYLAPGMIHREEVVLVTLDRHGVRDASGRAIAARGIALGLTPREAEVLRWRAEGLSYQAVADALAISLDTVRTHIRQIHAKLGVKSVSAAVARIFAEGPRASIEADDLNDQTLWQTDRL